MDSFFGIGAPELVMILLLAGLVLGPHRIRQVAHWLGKTTAQLQAIARGFSRQLNAELDAVDGSGDLQETMREMKELRRQLADLRREVTSVASQPFEEGRRALMEGQKAVENSIHPPALNVKPGKAEVSKTPPAAGNGADPSLPSLLDIADDPD
ncbi:MAG: twin-arginine translocase TatA/TatE family subunit [Ardenticatenaceae bacterium]|nr:twin-arginine translocase TatA/TatE family subunit [Anaerolineales bacterium]MCB8985201.1 twin-arginine translocase TatA/TatE family subunit [Ardenticatenaceae bacterium]